MITETLLKQKIYAVLANSSAADKQHYQELYKQDKSMFINVDGIKCEIFPGNYAYYDNKNLKAYSYRYVQTVNLDIDIFRKIIQSV